VHKILIVEDEPDIARVLQAYLAKAGFRVEVGGGRGRGHAAV